MSNAYLDVYNSWLNNPYFDDDFIKELKSIKESEIEDVFYKDLEFGTAGLRGLIGAGKNRMNKYIVMRATQGYAKYLLSKEKNPTCVIARDMRHGSEEFNKVASEVLAANGIKVYTYKDMRSTPQLSFSVRYLKTTGGIVITASHNPKEYNGYKVYDNTGCQLVPDEAMKVTAYIEEIQDDFNKIKTIPFDEALKNGQIVYVGDEIDDAYIEALMKEQIHPEAMNEDMKILYTPFHGTGIQIMPKLFKKIGVDGIITFDKQMIVDPNFSTVKKPNPEEVEGFEPSIEYAKEINADMIIATDPDSDRMAMVIKSRDGNYVALNGNEIGSLLTYYVLSERNNLGTLKEKSKIVKTIVTGDLPFAIARKYNVTYDETLTGFKYIGEKSNQYESRGENFVLGFEEAIGFLIGKHARDKDGVVATLIGIEMAKYYHSKGKNLLEVLEDIYAEFGYYVATTVSVTIEGIEGMHKINKIMQEFRNSFIEYYNSNKVDFDIKLIRDYEILKETEVLSGVQNDINLVKSDALKYVFDNGDWICVRPSGTEPKIKFYYCVSSDSKNTSVNRIEKLKNIISNFTKNI